MTTDTPTRRKWNITRWLLVFALVAMGWSEWRAYTFRSALAEAKALGLLHPDPGNTIRENRKATFKEDTWLNGVTRMHIPTNEVFEQNLAIVHRLNPKELWIENAATLRDLSALKPLTRLQDVTLTGCTGLTNVDGLKNLSALQKVYLSGCTGLTNVDALKNLSVLQEVDLTGCTGLTNVDALKNLSALQEVRLDGCTGLTNVDALKNLSALQSVELAGCKGLTNVDGLKNLPALQTVDLFGCTGLTKESVASLRAALPNTKITGK